METVVETTYELREYIRDGWFKTSGRLAYKDAKDLIVQLREKDQNGDYAIFKLECTKLDD